MNRPARAAAPAMPVPPRSLGALLRGLAAVTPRNERAIRGLSLDSRRVRAGDLFIAVPGETRDGRDFIRQAVRNGAAAVAREKVPGVRRAREYEYGVPDFDVAGLRKNIGVIADRFYDHPSAHMQVIGITGTNGKTTCAWLLAQALDLLGRRCALLGTLGAGFVGALAPSPLTTADAVASHRALASLRAKKAAAVCIEASSHGLEQGRVNQVAFDVALFTNLSRDHLDYHRSMARYARAKRKLFRFHGLRVAVVNVDDPFGRRLLEEHRAERALGYGLRGGDVRPQNLRLDENGIAFEVRCDGRSAAFRSPLIGALNVPNLLAVIATLIACGHDLERIAAVLGQCGAPPGRMQLLRNDPSRPAVVVDYAHTPDALARALASVRELCRGRLWVVFGCGGDRDRGKRPCMGKVAARLADRVIVTDDNPRTESARVIAAHIVKGVPAALADRVAIIHDRRRAIESALTAAAAEDIVLVAGKGHEATQTIGERVLALDDREVVAGLQEATAGCAERAS